MLNIELRWVNFVKNQKHLSHEKTNCNNFCIGINFHGGKDIFTEGV